MKDLPWDLYQYFLAVARHSGLAGAARELGISSATLGRKILELEEITGEKYFQRSQTGYALTGPGQLLLNILQEMEGAARKVAAFQGASASRYRVRIMAGTWNTLFLTGHIEFLCTEADAFLLDFITTEERARLLYREADVGLRAQRPEETNLAAQRLPDASYGIYKARNARVPENRWIAMAEEHAISTYLRWPHEHRKDDIAFTVTRPTTLRDLIVSGAGMGLLPCICGEREPSLERVEIVPDIGHEQWLVMNRDDRHRPEIRSVINRLVKLFKDHAYLMNVRR